MAAAERGAVLFQVLRRRMESPSLIGRSKLTQSRRKYEEFQPDTISLSSRFEQLRTIPWLGENTIKSILMGPPRSRGRMMITITTRCGGWSVRWLEVPQAWRLWWACWCGERSSLKNKGAKNQLVVFKDAETEVTNKSYNNNNNKSNYNDNKNLIFSPLFFFPCCCSFFYVLLLRVRFFFFFLLPLLLLYKKFFLDYKFEYFMCCEIAPSPTWNSQQERHEEKKKKSVSLSQKLFYT